MKKVIFALAAIISLAACSNHDEKGTLVIEQWRADGSVRRDTVIDDIWTDVCYGDILFTKDKDTVEEVGFYKLAIGDSLFVAPGPIHLPYPTHSVKRIK